MFDTRNDLWRACLKKQVSLYPFRRALDNT